MKVFIFEDAVERVRTFHELLPTSSIEVCDNVEVAKKLLLENTYQIAFLDHDMDFALNQDEGNNGSELAKFIVENKICFIQVFVHSMNVVCGDKMIEILNNSLEIKQVHRTPFPSLVAMLRIDKNQQQWYNYCKERKRNDNFHVGYSLEKI